MKFSAARTLKIYLPIVVLALFGSGCKKTDSGNLLFPTVRPSAEIEVENVPVESKATSSWPNLYGPNHQSLIVDDRIRSVWEAGPPRELWRIDVGTGYSSPVLKENRVVVVHRKGDSEIIECFSAENGSTLWSKSFPATYECRYDYSSGPYSTPVIYESVVIAVGQSGMVHCLDLISGQLHWKRDLFDDYEMALGEWPVAASGIVLDGIFVFNLGAVEKNAGVIGLDVSTGKSVWESTTHAAGHATPNRVAVAGGFDVVLATCEGLLCLDPKDGKKRWFFPFQRRKAGTYNAVSPVVFNQKVCMVTGPGPGTLVVEVDETGAAKEVWKDRRILDSQYTNLLCADGFIFGFTPMKQGGSEMRCINMEQKQLCWKWKAGLGRSMIVADQNTIFILGERGTLAGIQLSNQEPIEKFRTESPILDAPCYSAPAIYNARLYARNEEHLVCLDLTGSGSAVADLD